MFTWALRKSYATNNPFADVQPIGRIVVGKPQVRVEEAMLFIGYGQELEGLRWAADCAGCRCL